MKILVVEDDPLSRQLIKTPLQRAGYEVVEAEDGQAAWELFQREPFPLVITDWMMPELDGPALVQKIRSSGQKSYTYILMLTAMDDTNNVVAGLESGADEYLTKPFNGRELVARVASGARILRLEEQLTEAHSKMEILAMHDGLTGLFNRRAIEEHAGSELDLAKRKERAISMLLLDVDHFKSINDKYGHKSGDDALQQLAHILTENLRQYDRAGRWGGEEFLVTLPETQLSEALTVAERLRARVAETKLSLEGGGGFSMQISVGAAFACGPYPSLSKLIDAADKALYQAKESGRNRVCSYDKPIE
jgi:two-component system, cell cycle response regulator